MKQRILQSLLIGVLMLGRFPLFGCAGTYRITYENCESAFVKTPQKAKPGTNVVLKKKVVTDRIETVFLNGAELQSGRMEDGLLLYSFTMPEQDVTITVASKDISAVETIMLLDYYTAPAATDEAPGEENGYYELVLYDDGSSDLLLVEYQNGGTPSEEVCSFRITREAENEVKAIIDRYRMDAWQESEEYDSLEGVLNVCRFCLDGVYYRVTSEHMPDNGTEAFSEIRRILTSFLPESP